MWFKENKACNFFLNCPLWFLLTIFFSVCFYKKIYIYTAILTYNTEKLWKSLFSVSGAINLALRIFCLFYDNFQVALQSSYFQGWFRQMYLIKFYKSLLCLFNLETYHHIFFAKGIRSFFGQIQMLIRLVYHNRLLCSFWELLCNNREV